MNPDPKIKTPAVVVEISHYLNENVRDIADIFTASVRSLATPYYSDDQINAWAPSVPDLAQWAERLAPLHTVVAQIGAASVGFTSYAGDGYLDLLFTHPSFARRGVATQLLLHVETRLRATGAPRIFTHASLAARPFFDAHGFRLEAKEKVARGGSMLERFSMYKSLLDV